jgi:hypothetical protein
MQKCKKNFFRKLVVGFLIILPSVAKTQPTENITLEIGQSKTIEVLSDETLKVKGNSIHVYQSSQNTYQIIALRKGVSILDPTPTSREQNPIIISVEPPRKSQYSCLPFGLTCAERVISGQIIDLRQVYFINAILEKDWVDLTTGTITSKTTPIKILGSLVSSISKLPGRILVIEGKVPKVEKLSLNKSFPNLTLHFLDNAGPTKKIKVYFEISESDSLETREIQLSQRPNLPASWNYGGDSSRNIIASASKIFSLTDQEKFAFKESFKPKEWEVFNFSGSGTISWNPQSATIDYQVALSVGTEISQVKSSLKATENAPILLSESKVNSNRRLKNLTLPWAKIPIVGPLFRTLLTSTYQTNCRIWLEILNATE